MYAEVKEKVAVSVPEPLIVAVVFARDGLAIDIDPEAIHDEKE
jgi:hypothetical protein